MKSKDNCTKIFMELKDKGCIKASQKIEESEKCKHFGIRHAIIYYNPNKNEMDKKSISFCLLHEEKHIRIPYRYIVFFVVSCIPLLAIFS